MKGVLECLLFVMAISPISGLYFHISETEKKCFIEEIPDETMVIGTYPCQLQAQPRQAQAQARPPRAQAGDRRSGPGRSGPFLGRSGPFLGRSGPRTIGPTDDRVQGRSGPTETIGPKVKDDRAHGRSGPGQEGCGRGSGWRNGRASGSQPRGRRFEPLAVHSQCPWARRFTYVCLSPPRSINGYLSWQDVVALNELVCAQCSTTRQVYSPGSGEGGTCRFANMWIQ